MESGDTKKPFFRELDPDDDDQQVTEIESLCMNCHEQGMTRLLLTKIPHFKELILSSFSCDECGFENREVQFGGKIQEKGTRITLNVKTPKDLNRQVVKSENAVFYIPDLEFEQPATKGDINTVEGVIDGVVNGLKQDQPVRKALEPETAVKIEAFIKKLETLKTVKKPFKIILDDPSGNSHIENPDAPRQDPDIDLVHYTRTEEQEKQLGVNPDDAVQEEDVAKEGDDLKDEVLKFPGQCPGCSTPCETLMKVIDIPFFKQVVIMATNCDACGLKENEVKGGTGIAEKGTSIKLKLTDITDLSRDILKSDTCGVEIPELELELEHGTLGGKFTTLEGLLTDIKDQLSKVNPFMAGDSSERTDREKLDELCVKIQKLIDGDVLGHTFIMDDPAGNSYLQNVYAPDPDPEMEVTHYVRNQKQNDLLGITEMNTEDYLNKETS